MASEVRRPEIGDLVTAIGKGEIVFCVAGVNKQRRTADLESMPAGTTLTNVPWMALSYALNATRD